ncbi:hypothetical protein LHYA1_G007115 [Lachnellula hyalina]|uniref:Proteasome inhibitor PI31 subunit n=1 Tax=Lachnellula hyalina TaxID=1316788 RepID=A0A8H8QY45_9HELO|nr:uncharacterized protein LHYA1_G007115 [Lachnellula hyalina]TVY23479.1 hypothetical protein LHYA1_G007115 [Lachnellula hyalina]
MANNPLSTDSILKYMADALPTHAKDATDSDISSSYEAIALFSHACMVAVGFRLLGFGEDQKIEAECERLSPRLSTKWNSSFGSHSFLYAHSQSSMQYVVKVDRLGGKAEIRGIGLGDERISRFEITAKDYISSAALPLRIKINQDGEEDRSDLEAKLKEVFISPSRIQGLHKEGYEESANASSAEASRVREEREQGHGRRPPPPDPMADPEPARPYPFQDPLAADPRRPLPQGDFPPPGFDDEYDMNRPLRGMVPPVPGARSPFGIGHDDLHPLGLGPNDPLRGSFVPGGGFGGGGGGGMHPTFDDPLFGGANGRGRGQGGPQNPFGARYDPLGPGDVPRGGLGGRPPNPFGGFGNDDFI